VCMARRGEGIASCRRVACVYATMGQRARASRWQIGNAGGAEKREILQRSRAQSERLGLPAARPSEQIVRRIGSSARVRAVRGRGTRLLPPAEARACQHTLHETAASRCARTHSSWCGGLPVPLWLLVLRLRWQTTPPDPSCWLYAGGTSSRTTAESTLVSATCPGRQDPSPRLACRACRQTTPARPRSPHRSPLTVRHQRPWPKPEYSSYSSRLSVHAKRDPGRGRVVGSLG